MGKHKPPFTAYLSDRGATVNGKQVSGWTMYNSEEVDPLFSEMLDALKLISSNKHINLGDLVYQVREKEGEGWEGASVKAWSEAVSKIEKAIAKAERRS